MEGHSNHEAVSVPESVAEPITLEELSIPNSLQVQNLAILGKEAGDRIVAGRINFSNDRWKGAELEMVFGPNETTEAVFNRLGKTLSRWQDQGTIFSELEKISQMLPAVVGKAREMKEIFDLKRKIFLEEEVSFNGHKNNREAMIEECRKNNRRIEEIAGVYGPTPEAHWSDDDKRDFKELNQSIKDMSSRGDLFPAVSDFGFFVYSIGRMSQHSRAQRGLADMDHMSDGLDFEGIAFDRWEMDDSKRLNHEGENAGTVNAFIYNILFDASGHWREDPSQIDALLAYVEDRLKDLKSLAS
jgi:hypothetical protein